jgi:hypothetical protein
MGKSAEESYLEYLDSFTSEKGEFRKISDEGVTPPVYVIIYRDVPEPGMLSAFTLGLSSVEYHEWKIARPELAISVQSQELAWALAIGYTAYKARGKYGFHVGETINFKAKIAQDSEMTAFFIFNPTVLTQKEATLELPERTITILQLYPIYTGEMEWIRNKGFGNFLAQNIDFSDVKRRDYSEE